MVQFTIINIGTLSMNKFWDETERMREPSATCTLLQAGGKRLLVDPSPHPAPLAQQLFDRTGLRPEAIDAVFCTHWHGDHRFGLALFEDKPWLMAEAGLVEWRARAPQDAGLIDRFVPAKEKLPQGVDLVPTPGHTMGHHSLIADTKWGKLIVAGDAAMTPEFLAAEEGFHNSIDFTQAADTIRQIKGMAKLVIPGHGNLILNF
jgi:glyoxylase-like metal-dependent hydrolase (beta-lactamase superfamily II)